MKPAFTLADRNTMRDRLQQADHTLAQTHAEDHNPASRERLEFAHAAVRDALREVSDNGDAAVILVALEAVGIGDLSAPAARDIEAVRAICRAL
jgi:DNA-directed RNA polymerase specialized sigma24 family protein